MTEHIVKVLTSRLGFRAWCTTCGWTGARWNAKPPASADAALHADRMARKE